MKGKLARIITVLLMLCFITTGCGQATDAKEDTTQDEQTSTEERVPTKDEVVEDMIASMSIEEKIGQLLMCDFRKNADDSGMTMLSDTAAEAIQTYHLGGVILFAENVDTAEQTTKLVADMQALAKIGLLIGIDEEGGLVSRLGKSNIPHETIEAAADMVDEARAQEAGTVIGSELVELGINVDFAPIADINTNPDNTVIGNRAFSPDPQIAGNMVGAFVTGLQSQGVSGAAKHFPGHGDTAADSHNGEVYVTHDLERLKTTEFVPFQMAIDKGVDFVMVGHIKVPNVTTEDVPATLSSEMIEILRQDLGFQGLIITDAMNMGAIVQYYGSGEAAVSAIQAGIDIVLMPADIGDAVAKIIGAVDNGEISEERVDESLKRILSLKYEKGLIALN